MGTSISYGTPTKGNWTSVKRGLTSFPQSTHRSETIKHIVSNVAQGFTQGSHSTGGGGGSRVTGGLVGSSARNAIAGGAGFLGAVRQSGFNTALAQLGITDAAALSGVEIIDRITQALVDGRLSLDQEIANTALRETLLEILGVEQESFQQAVETFMDTSGITGFVETFLARYIIERIWQHIAEAARDRIGTEAEIGALYSGIESLCRVTVNQKIAAMSETRGFANIDWFGGDGRSMANQIADDIQGDIEGML